MLKRFKLWFWHQVLDNACDAFMPHFSLFYLFHQGVWHSGGSQREILHWRLLCESDITGAGVPQLRPVPALHRQWEEVRWSKESVLPFSILCVCVCVGRSYTAGVYREWSRASFISSSIFPLTSNAHTHKHWACRRTPKVSISTTVSRQCVFVGSFILLYCCCVMRK